MNLPGMRRCRTVLALILAMGACLSAADSAAATLHEQSLAGLEIRLAQAKPHDFTFAVLGDSRDNDEVFQKILSLAQSIKPLFILHAGDLAQAGCQPDIDHFLQILRNQKLEIPLFVVPGNHEICHDDKGTHGRKDYFQQTIGPLSYVLDLPPLGVKIVVLDNSDYVLTVKQLRYLQQELSGGRSLNFVAMHIPPQTARWGKVHTFTKGAQEMLTILTERNVTGAFFGHIHLFDEDRLGDTRMIITGGGGAPLYDKFGFGRPAFHILVVRVKNGVASMQPVWLP